MDAEEITAKRTAVCSALATAALADPDSKILAVIGAGVQAESHIEALRHLYSFNEVGNLAHLILIRHVIVLWLIFVS